jgi:hypothetical protein
MHALTLRFSSIGLGLCAGFAIQAACTTHVTNDSHCFYHEGNATCVARYDDDLPYCGTACLGRDGNPSSPNGDGCVDFVPEDGCYSPCGNEEDVTENDMCSVADTGTSDPTSATEPTATSVTMTDATTADSTSMTMSESADSTTSAVECNDSSECDDPNLPICLMQTCSSCVDADEPDAACAARDPALGVCGNDGACVQCTGTNTAGCTGATPVCDEGSNTCIGCTDHAQCMDSACAFETGECLDPMCVVDVDGDGGQDYTSIQAAVSAVGDGEDCTIIVHQFGVSDTYATVTIEGGKRIALLAAADDEPVIQGNTGAGIEVMGGATLYARGLDIRGNTDDLGIDVSDAGTSAYVDQCEVMQNTEGGIAVTTSAYLRLRNSMVGGANSTDIAALRVQSASIDVVYATIVGYDDGFGGGVALRCSGSTVSVRNSLLVKTGVGTELDCDEADITFTATETNTPGSGNVALGSVMPDWFISPSSDLHLDNPPGALLSAAEWHEGDPATDIDGDSRPDVDGTADIAGADVP